MQPLRLKLPLRATAPSLHEALPACASFDRLSIVLSLPADDVSLRQTTRIPSAGGVVHSNRHDWRNSRAPGDTKRPGAMIFMFYPAGGRAGLHISLDNLFSDLKDGENLKEYPLRSQVLLTASMLILAERIGMPDQVA